ncbi:MAG: hypothetical protein JWN18_284 [Parcubacteria group bacterium]|nr:hypothetical protein [Parcubacteria group bacterium]
MESTSTSRGFTILELLVVLGIITVITAVAITSQSSFNKSLVLSNTAYDLALSIRSAQTFGIGSRLTTPGVGGVSNAGYGIYIKKNGLQSTPITTYTIFADISPACAGGSLPNCKPGNGIYDGSDPIIQTFTLGNGVKISDFCVYDGSPHCAWSSGSSASSVDIVFTRPNADPVIKSDATGGNSEQKAYITLMSTQGTTRYVCVTSMGVIMPTATTPTASANCP